MFPLNLKKVGQKVSGKLDAKKQMLKGKIAKMRKMDMLKKGHSKEMESMSEDKMEGHMAEDGKGGYGKKSC